MAEHSFKLAKKLEYRAMQFNMVVSTNKNAVKLWQDLGFKIMATIPQAFCHKEHGLVDSYIMYKILE